MKLELLTNATVATVSRKSIEKLESSPSNSIQDDKEESNERDYDEDEDQLEGETGEIAATNQVF
jgi:hypothetical protein